MKFLLLLLLAVPSFAQFQPTKYSTVPCNTSMQQAGRDGFKSLKQGGMVVDGKRWPLSKFYKDPKVLCSPDGLILSMRLKFPFETQRQVDEIAAHLKGVLAGRGLSRVVIQGHYWDKTPADKRYSVTPVQVITTRSDSTTVSTVTGGRVVEHQSYNYKGMVATAIIDYE